MSTTELSKTEQELLSSLRSGKGLQEALAPMVKRVMEVALEGELDAHLTESPSKNRRNGKSTKRIKSSHGEFELSTPRDRDGSFEPQLIKKRQTVLTDDLDQKILNLYANGMSYSDIASNLEEIYQVKISPSAMSQITDRLLPELEEWRHRPLDPVYPIVYLDAMHVKVRNEDSGKVESRAIYSLLAINAHGRKDILGLYTNESEGAHFWAGVLASLKERGIEDILIACVDGLKGFEEAILAHFPETEVQLCVIHQIRHSLRYIASKDHKAFMRDLKTVYRASSKDQAEHQLLLLDEKWGKKYPVVIRSWHNNWDKLSTYFKYDENIRKLIYTTNAVEGLHRMVRKYTKSKAAFTAEKALTKLVFCAYKKITDKWNDRPVQNWAMVISQIHLHFGDRFKLDIK